MINSTQKRYNGVAMIIHWLTAFAVIALWRIAESAEEAEHANMEAEHIALIVQHKALGITVLALTLLRIFWKLGHPAPALPSTMAKWEVAVFKVLHFAFYVLLLGLPLAGWAASSFADYPISMWGAFEVPLFPVEVNKELARAIMSLHKTGGEAIIILMFIHILAALKHTFVTKTGGIWKMLPFGHVPD